MDWSDHQERLQDLGGAPPRPPPTRDIAEPDKTGEGAKSPPVPRREAFKSAMAQSLSGGVERPNKPRRIRAKNCCNLQELDHVEPALAAFEFGDE